MSDPRTTAEARSLLFVPGSRPDRFAKAAASGADNLIIDLEDAVAPGSKEAARTAAAQYLQDQPAIVRINAADTSWYAGDLAALAKTAQLAGVVLPKAASVDAVESLVEVLPHGTPVLLLIESAVGLRDAHQLAGVTGVTRLMFGNLDFALDAGITARSAEQSELLYARSTLVVASRAAGLPGPVDGVYPDVSDPEGLHAAVSRTRDLGFTGVLCIHPTQIDVVHEALRPTEEELALAQKLLDVAGDADADAFLVDGQMIDTPRWELARRLVRAAD